MRPRRPSRGHVLTISHFHSIDLYIDIPALLLQDLKHPTTIIYQRFGSCTFLSIQSPYVLPDQARLIEEYYHSLVP